MSLLSANKHRLMAEKDVVMSFVHQITEDFSHSLNQSELWQHILDAALKSTGASKACIYKHERGHLERIVQAGLFPPQGRIQREALEKTQTRSDFVAGVSNKDPLMVGQGIIGKVAQYRDGVLIRDPEEEEDWVHYSDPSLRVRSLMVIPIVYQNDLLGVLALANPLTREAFSEMDFSLSTSLAEQSGLAIHNLNLLRYKLEKTKLDMDLSLAGSIQNMLLPKSLPRLASLDIAADYLPMRQVGGDLYDITEVGPHQIGVSVADVSGKGISAAMLMTMCFSHLKNSLARSSGPLELVKQMNESLTLVLRKDMFVTFFYGVIDTQEETLRFVRAGHELPIVVYSGNQEPILNCIDSDGIALGMVPGALFDQVIQEQTVPFPKGASLILYTDGITEHPNKAGTDYSLKRLKAVCESSFKASAREMNRSILNNVTHFSQGAEPADDITLLTIKHV